MVETTSFIIDFIDSIKNKDRFVLTNNGWFTDSLLAERCPDGGERVKLYAGKTRRKNEGRLGRRSPRVFFPSSIFCPRSTTWMSGIG